MNTFAKLRSKGHRITSQRQNILQKIKLQPQTVEEIHEELKNKVDLASVYRALKLFVKNKAIRVVNFGDGKKRYELIDQDNHHHHTICNSCGTIKDIALTDEEKIIRDAAKNANFQIKSHSLELFGLCQKCQ